MRQIIVGYDAGETNAVAIFDLNENLLATLSKKGAKTGEIVEFINQNGNPCLLCVDVKKVPDDAKKLAAIFNCALWAPEKDIREKEKARIGKIYSVKNVHERDAVVAAHFAIKEKENKLRKIDALEGVDREKVKGAFLGGRRISDALEPEITPKVIEYAEKPKHMQRKVEKRGESLIAKLVKRVGELEEENGALKKIIEGYAIQRKVDKLCSKREEVKQSVEDVVEEYRKGRARKWQQV